MDAVGTYSAMEYAHYDTMFTGMWNVELELRSVDGRHTIVEAQGMLDSTNYLIVGSED